MKKLLFTAFGLCLLAACSQDEVMEVNRNGDEITFDVVTNAATRAENVYCNLNQPTEFYVSAISDGKTYIDKDHIVASGSSWTNKSGTRYWPETTTDFYAHVNGGSSYAWSVAEGKATAQFKDFTVNDVVASQVDLLYAVKTNQTKETAPVKLNFRHALSQIVFQAKNTNANLYVEIAGVKVANVGNKNTFTFPSANTDNNIAHEDYEDGVYEDGDWGSITYDDSWGTWASLTSGTSAYEVDFANVSVKGDNKLVSLTTTIHKENAEKLEPESYANAMLLLPQNTTQWVPSTTSPQPDVNNTGSYFLVDCVIYNVASTDVDKDEDVCLWGKENEDGTWSTKELAIPVAFNWEQGKKYVYTFVFGKGNGGYDPDPDPDPEPDPVLVPIEFEITVDEFVPVDGGDIESGIPGTDAGAGE